MKTWQWLGYLGLLPFVICLWLFEQEQAILAIEPQTAFVFYSAIILSFLAGSLWHKDATNTQSKTQIISNLFCLYAFACLFFPLYFSLFLLPAGYLGLLVFEYCCCHQKDKSYSKAYFIMRLILTSLVCLLHIGAFVLWH